MRLQYGLLTFGKLIGAQHSSFVSTKCLQRVKYGLLSINEQVWNENVARKFKKHVKQDLLGDP
jgi:hypothetical protein